MSKKANHEKFKIARLTHGERAPPLLSERFIAEFQRAVNAAQCKRKPPARSRNPRSAPSEG